mmetsp:Transcript_28306/g.51706  ORF Transcript_28306/g.51706 Transcript_28306/m.51706 type:complete len:195 (+) Transcript_28306:247-831(+)
MDAIVDEKSVTKKSPRLIAPIIPQEELSNDQALSQENAVLQSFSTNAIAQPCSQQEGEELSPTPKSVQPGCSSSSRRQNWNERKRISWKTTDWDDAMDLNFRGSTMSNLRSSQSSMYQVLDFDDYSTKGSGDDGSKEAVTTKKRTPLQETFKHDDEAFETSLQLLSLGVKLEKKPPSRRGSNCSIISTLSESES